MAERYRPSNGTEGELFMSRFCYRCKKDRREDRPCKILSASLIFGVNDPEYPKEWVEGDTGPRCTAFVERGSVSAKLRSSAIRDKRQLSLDV